MVRQKVMTQRRPCNFTFTIHERDHTQTKLLFLYTLLPFNIILFVDLLDLFYGNVPEGLCHGILIVFTFSKWAFFYNRIDPWKQNEVL